MRIIASSPSLSRINSIIFSETFGFSVENLPSNAVRTDERFIDETTGKPVTVYVDPVTGERSYVQE